MLMSLASHCGSGESGNPPANDSGVVNGNVVDSTAGSSDSVDSGVLGTPALLTGVVVDTNELPLSGALVRVGAASSLTDAQGRFALSAPLGVAQTLVATAVSFAPAERLVPASTATHVEVLAIRLVALTAATDIDGKSGGLVAGIGIAVTVPAGAFSGKVKVSAALLPLNDPLTSEDVLPAPLPKIAGATMAPLFGLALDAEGQQPTLPLSVTIVTSAALPIGVQVPVGRFDQAQAKWIDAGTAISDGTKLAFSIDHLSVFAGALPAVPKDSTEAPALDSLQRLPSTFLDGEPRVDPRSGALQVGVELPALVRRGDNVAMTLFHDSRTVKAELSVAAAAPDLKPDERVLVSVNSALGSRRIDAVGAKGVSAAAPATLVTRIAERAIPDAPGTGASAIDAGGAATAQREALPGSYDVQVTTSRAAAAILLSSPSLSFTKPVAGDALAAGTVAAPAPVLVSTTQLLPMAIDNRNHSAFGAGWHLQGLTRLVGTSCGNGVVTLLGELETPALVFGKTGDLQLRRFDDVLIAAGAPVGAELALPLVAAANGAYYIGLIGNKTIWRVTPDMSSAALFAGGGRGTTGEGDAQSLALSRMWGLAADPAGQGVLVAADGYVSLISPGGIAQRIIGGFSAGAVTTTVPVANGAKAIDVDLGTGLMKMNAGRAPGVYLLQDFSSNYFLVKDGVLHSLRTRTTHPHGLTVAIDAQGTIYYTVVSDPCIYKQVDGLTDPEIFPSCLAGTPAALVDGPAAQALVGQVSGMEFDPNGNLWMWDQTFDALRRMNLDGGVITAAGGRPGPLAGAGGPAKDAVLGSLWSLTALGATDVVLSGSKVLLNLSPLAEGTLQPLSGGDGSLLRKQTDGTWLRTLSSGVREVYDADGLLVQRGRSGDAPWKYTYATPDHPDATCGRPKAPPSLLHIDLGNEVLFRLSYDSVGHLVKIEDAAVRATTLTWQGEQVSKIVTPAGQTSFTYDADNHVATRVAAAPASVPATWSYIYKDGRITDVDVPARGRKSYRSAEDSAAVAETSFTAAGTARGLLAGAATAQLPTRSGGTATVTLAADRMNVRDPAGNASTIEMDSLGRLRRTQQADGAALLLSRDATGRIVEIFNEQTLDRWTYRYDGATDRVAQRVDPAGNSTTWSYDAEGRLLRRNEPGGVVTALTYSLDGSSQGLPLRIEDALKRATLVAYDSAGNPIKLTSPSGQVTLVERDIVGRPVKLTEPSGLVHVYTYDKRDGMTSETLGDPVDKRISTWTRETTDAWSSIGSHVPASSVASASDPAGRRWSFTRDAAWQATALTSPAAGDSLQSFDANGHLTARSFADGSSETMTYDTAGRLQKRVWNGPAAGQWLELAYDPLGRPKTLADAWAREERTYAPGVGWTRIDVAAQGTAPALASFSLVRTRLAYGLTSETLGASSFILQRDFDGRVTTVEHEIVGTTGSRRQVLAVERDATRAITKLTRGNGTTTTRSYDSLGRVTGQIEQSPSATVTLAFTYDDAGRPATRTQNGVSRTYAYDAQGHLISCSDTAESYAYDLAGLRAKAGTLIYQRDTRGRLLSDGVLTFAYDLLGRRTSQASTPTATDRLEMIYGPGGLMSEIRRGPQGSATTAASYVWDGNQRRVLRTVGTATSIYGYLPDSDRPVRVVDDAGSEWHLVHALGSAAYTLAMAGTAERYVHVDPFERVLGISDEKGTLTLLAEDCFGRPLSTPAITGPLVGFHGMPLDTESGFFSAGPRTYDPARGEFLTPEPGGLQAGMDEYGYGRGNPTIAADPSGRLFFLAIGAALAGYAIYNEIKNFAQSPEVKKAQQSYRDMGSLEDDKLDSGAEAHERLTKAADKGGDVAIKCEQIAIKTITNPGQLEKDGKKAVKTLVKEVAKEVTNEVKKELKEALAGGTGDDNSSDETKGSE